MPTWIKRLLGPPVFEDERKTRVAGVLNVMLWALLVVALSMFLILTVGISEAVELPRLIAGLLGGTFLILIILLRAGYPQLAGIFLLLGLWSAFTYMVYTLDGVRDSAVVGYYIVIIVAGLLMNRRIMYAFGALSLVAILGAYLAEVNGQLEGLPGEPSLSDIAFLLGGVTVSAFLLSYIVGRINAGFERARRDAQALSEKNEALQTSQDILEQQTQQLERRTQYLEVTAAIARDAISMLSERDLLSHVVSLIGRRLGFYHVGAFLIDASGEWATLQAAAGAESASVLTRGHRVRVGQEDIVGYVAGSGEFYVISDAEDDAGVVRNAELPHTRSELAMPLWAQGEIIGVLDIHSRESEAFSEEDVAALQALADQIALSLNSARLFQQVQDALEAERRAYGQLSERAWQDLIQAQPGKGFVKEQGVISPAGDAWLPEMERAFRSGEPEVGANDGGDLAIPVKVRDQVVGVIGACKSGETWSPEQVELLQVLAGQLGLALESARLYQDTQRRAAQERLTTEIAGRVRESLDMENVLQTAVREIRGALGLHDVEIRLAVEGNDSSAADG